MTDNLPMFCGMENHFPIPEYFTGHEKANYKQLAAQINDLLENHNWADGLAQFRFDDETSFQVVEALEELCNENGYATKYHRSTGIMEISTRNPRAAAAQM